jgi:predicted DNA-binding protein YlxM (UPF0122 family)
MEQKTAIPGVYKVKEGVLINKDNTALKAYQKNRTKNKMFDNLVEDVEKLKDDISEIKQLLRGLSK